MFVYREGRYSYDLLQTTTVTVGTESGALVEDTLRTIGRLTYSIGSGTSTPAVSITVDSLTIASVRDTATPIRYMAAPVVVTLPLEPVSTMASADSTAILPACDAMEDAARALASDVHVQIPAAVRQNQTWGDSSSFVICRGGIPLTGTRTSRFQITDVRESRDTVVARVSRQTTLVLAGVGSQGTRHITIRGEGTSETVFTYNVTAGRFLESTGQSILRLGFETIQQTDQITQRSSSSVRLRSGIPDRDN